MKNEIKCQKELIKQNYYVIRSLGSKGLFDIIAFPLFFPNKGILLIQVKSNFIGAREKKKLNNFSAPSNLPVKKEVWIYYDNHTKEILPIGGNHATFPNKLEKSGKKSKQEIGGNTSK